jgi:hypothetical protein
MLRFLVHTFLGVILGGALGVAVPIALYLPFTLRPEGDGGVGTAFALLMIFTVPAGVILGGLAGFAAAMWSANKPAAQKYDELHEISPVRRPVKVE